MRADLVKELGLSPLWKRRTAARPPSPFSDAGESTHSAKIIGKTDNAAQSALKSAATFAAKSASATFPSPRNADTNPPASSAREKSQADEMTIAQMDWNPLRETVAVCRRCALCETRTQAVFGVGDADADIFFVGEGPGVEEDRRGEPFVGPAGVLLDAMLQSIGIVRGRGIYIANIVKCRPPQNRNPKPEEARACIAYLRRQVELAAPRLIVALGGVAAAHLLQTEETVGKLRQRMHEYHGIPLAVTYHPAYLLRAPAEKRKSWDDLRLIRRLAAKIA